MDDLPQRVNGWKGIQSAKSTLSILHSEHKSCALAPSEGNMKGCKTSTYTNAYTSTHTNVHIQKLDFYFSFFLLIMPVSF